MESRWHLLGGQLFGICEQTHSSGVSREDFSHLLRKKTFPSVYREEKTNRPQMASKFLSSAANRPNSLQVRIKIQGEGERLAVCAVFVFSGTDEGDGHAVPFVLSQTFRSRS